MAIDWDGLVVGPCFAAFAEDVQVLFTPAKSAPGTASYDVDGVFDRAYLSTPQLDMVSAASTLKPILGVRLAQFTVPPVVDDLVYVASADVTFIIRNVEPDSHGWALLELNKVRSGP
jgi:hypothetical protein